MSKESAGKFVQAIIDDEELRNRTKDMKPEEVTAFAKEQGYDFTVDELKEAGNEVRELSPEELENAAGGSRIGHNGGVKALGDLIFGKKDQTDTHCKRDGVYTGFMHVFVKTGHVEEPELFGAFTLGYDIYTCKLCKYVKKVKV